QGPTLLELLETTRASESAAGDFRFPVQLVAKTKFSARTGAAGQLRGYMGRIESGRVSVGDRIAVLPSGLEARVQDIVTLDGSLSSATAPQSVTLLLDTQIDVSRGDMFAQADELPTVTNQITANLSWMSAQPLDMSRRYLIKHTTQTVRAVLEGIDHRLNVNTLERETGVTCFQLNDIGRVRLKTLRPLMVDAYRVNRITGSFILIDEVTNQTVAAGMILGDPANG
ncbi:MAG: sulfate adenylyltransferase, partial [Betaproteobacteria bacterium]